MKELNTGCTDKLPADKAQFISLMSKLSVKAEIVAFSCKLNTGSLELKSSLWRLQCEKEAALPAVLMQAETVPSRALSRRVSSCRQLALAQGPGKKDRQRQAGPPHAAAPQEGLISGRLFCPVSKTQR